MGHSFKADNVKLFSRLEKSPPLAFWIAAALALAPMAASAQTPAASPAPATPPPLPPTTVIQAPAGDEPAATPKPESKPTPTSTPEPSKAEASDGPKFMGATTCSSSLCHGGGSQERDAYTIWNKSDPHKRAFATLAGERAARIAQGLSLGAAAQSARCTVCHAPLGNLPEQRLAKTADPATEGVSCESCHGAAFNWIRSHTRRDLTHEQNVETGVRDLKSLYVRANTCVACHQVLEPELLTAGHPPLIFEMDAQTVAEPRHWVDKGDYFGPQAWLVGQAAALRETSWALSKTAEPLTEVREEWRSLVWVVQLAATSYGGAMPTFYSPNATDFSPGNVARAQSVADDVAHAASHLEWTRDSTRRLLDTLAGLHKEFVPAAGGGEPALALQNRAQRLVLALARLVAPFQAQDDAAWKPASMELDKLFTLADAKATFDGAAFADQLQRFDSALAPAGN